MTAAWTDPIETPTAAVTKGSRTRSRRARPPHITDGRWWLIFTFALLLLIFAI
jgi:hypothetical protein